jgi:hypothetical protein
MNIEETKTVAERVATVEGRVVSNEQVKGWHELIGHLQFEVANRAATLALQDHQVPQVAPKHILAKMQAAVAELNALLRQNVSDESTWRSDPEPICKAHLTKITRCDPCCDVLAHQAAHLHGDRLHSWAVANVYVDEELPF